MTQLQYRLRPATEQDFDFVFQLKKQTEYDAIKRVFGWDESLQLRLHQQEWSQAKPTIVDIDNKPIGSYLLERRSDHYYFGRFFILPEFQGMGLGSTIMRLCIGQAGPLPINLAVLRGNRAVQLYSRYSFSIIEEDAHFVYMQRESVCSEE
ncbi:GNAT family N-acetyltransferase [Vibrio sp. 10N]|uniref:GNAT family N-acetyltransferase n=1 Tax=Vibrio sp. 10N TaxID=3058938 RepID=UPI0028131459|nr:GNAT family N-acetyltransferase [Vibrio sp. 10N]